MRYLVFVLLAAAGLLAQVPIAFQYFYDDTGQLVKVVDSTGVVIEYVYDPVGNMLEIKRSAAAPGTLAIFSFTPQQGGPLATVTNSGQGFSPTPSLNTVRFNGVAASVLSATFTTLVVQIPIGALTGSISVTVGSNTSASAIAFTVLPIPVITSVSPASAPSGSVVASFQVTGVNLTGSTFSFVPTFAPPAITVGTVSVNPAGTSATLSLTVAGNASGDFALVATNSFGSSSAFPSGANTLHVGSLAYFNGQIFSILNGASPAPAGPSIREADGRVFSILNGASPAPAGPSIREADGLLFSILNGTSPAPTQPTSQEANGALFSVLNQAVAAIVSGTSSRVAVIGSRPSTTAAPALDAPSYGPDTDGDGIPDSLERLILTDPNSPDTDGDRFPDGLEVVLGSDPLDASSKPSILPPGDISGPIFSIQNLASQLAQLTEPRVR